MNRQLIGYIIAVIVLASLPFVGAYPIFVMKVMCYALFACFPSAMRLSWAAPRTRRATRLWCGACPHWAAWRSGQLSPQ